MDDQSLLLTLEDDRLEMRVDPYPASIQFAAFVMFIVGGVVSYFVISLLLDLPLACNLLGIIGGLIGGAAVAYTTEGLMRRNWTSNRFLHIHDDTVRFVFGDRAVREINAREHVNVLMWHFVTKRRTRVPKGWVVIALALEQDDIYLPIYTLMSPEAFDDYGSRLMFDKLELSKEEKQKNQDLRLAGRRRRLLIAETARSIDGVEVLPDDFHTVLTFLQGRFPGWMPRS